jgi:hypothetical protein
MGAFAARSASLLVLIGYVIAAQRLDVLALMLKIALPMLIATACIWFPDAFGDFSGVIHYRHHHSDARHHHKHRRLGYSSGAPTARLVCVNDI